MKRNRRKRAKWISDNILDIIALFFAVIPSVIAHFREKEVAWGFFCIVMNVLLFLFLRNFFRIFGDFYQKYMEYTRKIKRMRKEARKYGRNLPYDYAVEKDEAREDFLAECLAIVVRKCVPLGAFAGVIILVCVGNPQNAYAYWERVEVIIGFAQTREPAPDENQAEDAGAEPADTEERTQEMRDSGWRFVLDEPIVYTELYAQRKKQVFFENGKDFAQWVDEVQVLAAQPKGQKTGVDFKTIEDGQGNDYFTYTGMEDAFKDRVTESARYLSYEEWRKAAPHSSEYERCIAGRETLNLVKEGENVGCDEIWWLLANDYLYLAQEYERQTKSADTILYYYVNSIYCCMEALNYQMTQEEYETIYHFMVMRYHDLYREECAVSQEDKRTAHNIYSVLSETDARRFLTE